MLTVLALWQVEQTDEETGQVMTALSTGGRRQWAQFRALLEQKRHLDML